MIMMQRGILQTLRGRTEQGDVIHHDHWISMDIVERRGKKVTVMFVQEQATMTVQ